MRKLILVLLLLGVSIDEGACKKFWKWVKEKALPVIKKVIDALTNREVGSIDLDGDGALSEDELVKAFGEEDAYSLLALVDTNGDSILESDEMRRLAAYVG